MAVLVAVSIPIFTSKLEKAREATDVANMRAAKAAAVAAYLSEDAPIYNEGKVDTTTTIYYDAVAGKLTATLPKAYGKGTKAIDAEITEMGYVNDDYAGKVIKVSVTAAGDVTLSWVSGS